MNEPVTIAQIADAILGRTATTSEDFYTARVPMLGGCEGCHATIGAGNAYPSRSGFLRCADCIDTEGFQTVQAAREFMFGDLSHGR